MSDPESTRVPESGVAGGRGSRATGRQVREAEFSAFYRAFMQRLVGFLIWQGARPAVAAELAQDTMIDALRAWETIEHPQAWARTVASRKWGRRVYEAEPVADLPETTGLIVCTDLLEEWQARHDFLSALDSLPPRQRQVLAWHTSGSTTAEIATELGLSADAVRANLMKARRAAARWMTTDEGGQERD